MICGIENSLFLKKKPDREKNNGNEDGRDAAVINPIIPNSWEGKMPKVFEEGKEKEDDAEADQNNSGLNFLNVFHGRRKYYCKRMCVWILSVVAQILWETNTVIKQDMK